MYSKQTCDKLWQGILYLSFYKIFSEPESKLYFVYYLFTNLVALERSGVEMGSKGLWQLDDNSYSSESYLEARHLY